MNNNVIPSFTDNSNVLPQPTMSYGYMAPVYCQSRGCDSFIIIIVLFILLIIIGAIVC